MSSSKASATTRGVAFDIEIAHPESDWVGAGEPILYVNDRGRFKPGGLRARALRAIDRRAFRAADLVVSDTDAHAELFRSLGARRVETCFVGAEERIFRPGWSPPPSRRRSSSAS